jgi:hypothetical protein
MNLNHLHISAAISIASLLLSIIIIYIFFKPFVIFLIKSPSAFFAYPLMVRVFLLISIIAFLFFFLMKPSNIIRKDTFFFSYIFIILLIAEFSLLMKFNLNPKYNLKKINIYMKNKIKQDSFIVGQCALRAVFDTKIKAIPAYKGWFNDKNLFSRYPITHLLMLKKFRELSWIIVRYPERKDKINLVKVFPIWDTKITLYKLTNN